MIVSRIISINSRILSKKLGTQIFAFLALIQISSLALALEVTRGPYLQTATPNEITVVWRTDNRSDSVVRYGTSPNDLDKQAVVANDTRNHRVTLTGLSPATTYYYSVGRSSGPVEGGSRAYRFKSSPQEGSETPTRIWVIGDAGTANSDQRAVYNAYLDYPGQENTDLWLMLGDNAYNDGTDSEYQRAVFNVYEDLLKRTTLWSTLGNHDGHSANSDNLSGPYYKIFDFPRNAEAGGVASGTEAYYSFDYGNIHFVSLDSYDSNRAKNGAMLSWLRNDLASTNQKWIIAFFHHPPYSKGSHDTDDSSENRSFDMRENALPILEQYGVDLVLSGHSHSYERSYLIDGHYGRSRTFSSQHQIDDGNGRVNGDGAYIKEPFSSNSGTVYSVAGASGKTSRVGNHPAMFMALSELGSVVIDVNGDRLDMKYLNSRGKVRDNFTIQKSSDGGENPGESNSLQPGESLHAGNSIISNNGEYRLVMQQDGNLVIYNQQGQAIWSSNTVGSGADRLVYQSDGNLVIYAGNQAVWSSGTGGVNSTRLVIKNDGTLVMRNGDNEVWSSSGTPPTDGETKTLERRISDSDDDAEERANGSVKLDSSDLDIVKDKDEQVIGLRFTDLNIPNSAEILTAKIQFTADETQERETSLVIRGEDINNAPRFRSETNNISNRTTTNASVSWNPPGWKREGQSGRKQRTPDIRTIVQEIVSRNGWRAGNDMVFIIDGNGKRTAESYDGDQNKAAILTIEYKDRQSPGDTTPPVISLIGAAKLTIEQGSVFSDPGAQATDNIDGDISDKITVSGNVDTNVPGNYTLIYRVRDTAGNSAPEVLRTVVVNGDSNQKPRAIYPYSFGGLENLSAAKAVGLLTDLGYSGITVEARGKASLKRLAEYQQFSEQLGDQFSVVAAFMSHRFGEYGFNDADHRAAIDQLAGKEGQLWVWFRDDRGNVSRSQLENFVRQILDYATSKNVKLVLYPHENNMMETATEVYQLAEKINHPNLGIAFNLTHELNAGKGGQLSESINQVKDRIVAMTVSGANNNTNILSLDESRYDLKPYLRLIKSSGFSGPIGFLNFKLSNPADYLDRSFEEWQQLCKEVGLFEGDGGTNNPNGIPLPIEVLGEAGTQKSVSFSIDEPSNITHLYLECNSCGYEDRALDSDASKVKATVRINNGSSIKLKRYTGGNRPVGNQSINFVRAEEKYGGIGGAMRTVYLTVPIDGLVRGENTLTFEHKDAAAPSIGFRILNFNFLKNGNLASKVFSKSDFNYDNPEAWTPPFNSAEEIREGRELWFANNVLYDPLVDAIDGSGDGQIRASCSGCHASDGRDLKYFNFSNHSIIERSKFHRLSERQGKLIASYIRSLNLPIVKQAKPWNPPYQPGSGLDSLPAYEWAAGAGLRSVLEKDADMEQYLLPEGDSMSSVRSVVDRYSTLNFRELPIAIALPEWNQWLPPIHPDDALKTNSSAVRSDEKGRSVGKPFYDKLYEDAEENPTPKTLGALTEKLNLWIAKGADCFANGKSKAWRTRSLNGDILGNLRLPTPSLSGNCDRRLNRNQIEPVEWTKRGLAGWSSVKMWEIIHSNDLETESKKEGNSVCSGGRCINASESRGWVVDGRTLFDRAAHFIGHNSKKFVTQDDVVGTYENTAWYHLNLLLNPGYRDKNNMPSHFAYTLPWIRNLHSQSKESQSFRFWATMIKMRQLQTNGSYGEEEGLDLRTAQPYFFFSDKRANSSLNRGVGQPLFRRLVQASIEDLTEDAQNATPKDWAQANQNSVVQSRDSIDIGPCNGSCNSPFSGGAKQGRNTFRVIPYFRDIGVPESTINNLIDWAEDTWPRGRWDRIRN
ncbi:MAG: metallophosphoesterase [Gammaproteobacteria bacterium]|nr:metallophosphoesterase [Gammaproteobacteria bacterium]